LQLVRIALGKQRAIHVQYEHRSGSRGGGGDVESANDCAVNAKNGDTGAHTLNSR
jgi:hypothetical protein